MAENPARRRVRWWIPASLIVLGVGAAAYREIAFLEPALSGVGLLTALLLGAQGCVSWPAPPSSL